MNLPLRRRRPAEGATNPFRGRWVTDSRSARFRRAAEELAVSAQPAAGCGDERRVVSAINIPTIMKHHSRPENESKLILRGLHLSLTDAMRDALASKAARLFRHEPRILRLRIDVERDFHRGCRRFVAKGRIEIAGPDLVAAVAHENAYAAINLLIARFDRMLRKRMSNLLRRRGADDIRAHATLAISG